MRKRNHIIPLHLSKKELAHLEAQVKTSGLPREEFLRSLIMGAELRARPCDHHADLLHKVAGLCNNANQLARVANLRLDAIRAHSQDMNPSKVPALKTQKGEKRHSIYQRYPRPPPQQRHRLCAR